MTPQRRKGPRTKQGKRPTTGRREVPGERAKPRTTRTQPPGLHNEASTPKPAAFPALPPAELTLLDRAERLRDDILRSKLTHPDPWSYTAKARAWGARAQTLVEEIAVTGQTPSLHAAVATFSAEVEGDPDFQRARQLF